jgi:hypothetical protein
MYITCYIMSCRLKKLKLLRVMKLNEEEYWRLYVLVLI